jgi:hypothetical protein
MNQGRACADVHLLKYKAFIFFYSLASHIFAAAVTGVQILKLQKGQARGGSSNYFSAANKTICSAWSHNRQSHEILPLSSTTLQRTKERKM